MVLKFSPCCMSSSSLFLFIAASYSIIRIYHHVFIQEYLSYFLFQAIINRATIDTSIQVFLWTHSHFSW